MARREGPASGQRDSGAALARGPRSPAAHRNSPVLCVQYPTRCVSGTVATALDCTENEWSEGGALGREQWPFAQAHSQMTENAAITNCAVATCTETVGAVTQACIPYLFDLSAACMIAVVFSADISLCVVALARRLCWRLSHSNFFPFESRADSHAPTARHWHRTALHTLLPRALQSATLAHAHSAGTGACLYS